MAAEDRNWNHPCDDDEAGAAAVETEEMEPLRRPRLSRFLPMRHPDKDHDDAYDNVRRTIGANRKLICFGICAALVVYSGLSNAPAAYRAPPTSGDDKSWSSVGSAAAAVSSSAPRDLLVPSDPEGLDEPFRSGRGAASLPWGSDRLPSPVLLCQALMQEDDDEDGGPKPKLVRETSAFCRDRDRPFTTLVQIFASTLLAKLAGHDRVRYGHDCHYYEKMPGEEAVQQFLPEDVVVDPSGQEGMGRQEGDLETVCGCILSSHPEESIASTSWQKCIFDHLPRNEGVHPPPSEESAERAQLLRNLYHQHTYARPSMFESMLPSMSAALAKLAQEYEGYHSKLLKSKKTNGDHPTLPWHLVNEYDAERERESGAVIYLTPALELPLVRDPSDVYAAAVPLYVYAQELPRSVSSVSILVSSACAASSVVPRCASHGKAVHSFLTSLYPRAKVTIDVASSTALAYSRLTNAKYSLCPPSLGCTLPLLSKLPKTHGIIVGDSVHYPWLGAAQERFALVPEDRRTAILPEAFVPTMRTDAGEDSDFTDFLLENPPSRPSCHRIRGRLGSWIPTPPDVGAMSSGYGWSEGVYERCQAQPFSMETLCGALKSLGVRRLFFVGDADGTARTFIEALWKLGGFHPDGLPGSNQGTWTTTHLCPRSTFEDYSFEISYARNDRLNGAVKDTSYHKKPNCGKDVEGYCFPWIERFRGGPTTVPFGRTVLIADMGYAHRNDAKAFEEDFAAFTHLLGDFKEVHNDDVVFYRTILPGGLDGCEGSSSRDAAAPYGSYAEFEAQRLPFEEATKKRRDEPNWETLDSYNDMVDRILDHRRRNRLASLVEDRVVDVLDVTSSSVLRADARSNAGGGEENDGGGCARYGSADGAGSAADWWVQLLQMQLVDLAEIGA